MCNRKLWHTFKSYLSCSFRPCSIIIHRIRKGLCVIGSQRCGDDWGSRWHCCWIWTTSGWPSLLWNVCSHHFVSCPRSFSHFHIDVFLAFAVVFLWRHVCDVLEIASWTGGFGSDGLYIFMSLHQYLTNLCVAHGPECCLMCASCITPIMHNVISCFKSCMYIQTEDVIMIVLFSS